MWEIPVFSSSKVMTRLLFWCVLNVTIPSIFLRIAPILARPPQVMQPGTFSCTVFFAAKAARSNGGIALKRIDARIAKARLVFFMKGTFGAASGTANFFLVVDCKHMDCKNPDIIL